MTDIQKITPKAKKSAKSKKVSKNKRIVIDDSLELPTVHYKMTLKTILNCIKNIKTSILNIPSKSIPLNSLLQDIDVLITPDVIFKHLNSTPERLGPENTAKILTVFREHENQSIVSPPVSSTAVSYDHLTSQDFDEKMIYGLFYLYDEERYQYLKIKIAHSTIKNAGMGIYAVDDIPESAVGQYIGEPRIEDDTNMYYAWVVKSFDPVEGLPDDGDLYMYYLDATDLDKSNWTRYVNCGMKEKDNNIEQEQVYDKIFYVSTRKIKSGEELFIDYGEEYRVWNFGMDKEDY